MDRLNFAKSIACNSDSVGCVTYKGVLHGYLLTVRITISLLQLNTLCESHRAYWWHI